MPRGPLGKVDRRGDRSDGDARHGRLQPDRRPPRHQADRSLHTKVATERPGAGSFTPPPHSSYRGRRSPALQDLDSRPRLQICETQDRDQGSGIHGRADRKSRSRHGASKGIGAAVARTFAEAGAAAAVNYASNKADAKKVLGGDRQVWRQSGRDPGGLLATSAQM